jgi:uncharacterized small protein (DUF1192 family)
MPRVTKAELEHQIQLLQQENEELKQKVRRGFDRSRSPRLPAARSQASVATTCRALDQVCLWQRDAVMKEQVSEIQRLQAELVKKDEEIAALRRGEGPVGEVMAHIDQLWLTHSNFQRSPDVAAYRAKLYAQRTQPVHVTLREMEDRLQGMVDSLRGW